MSKVAIVGYGNVGYHLAKHISVKKHEVVIFSRNPQEDFVRPLDLLEPIEFNFIILSVPDDSVKDLSDQIDYSDAVILHTSGSRPLSDLNKHEKHGVMYPLQTLSKNKEVDFNTIPIFIEGSDKGENEIDTFVKSFSTNVRLLTSSSRTKLHLAAVFACNFSNHMFHLAEKLLAEIDMTFQDIQSLVEETLQKAIELNPSKSQTGPAIRGDAETVEKHIAMLKEERMRDIYELITKNIQELK